MGIEFRCIGCANLLRVEQEFAGRLTKCPACGQVQQAPSAASGNPFGPAPARAAQSGDVIAAGENPYASPGGSAPVPSTPAVAPSLRPQELDIGGLMNRAWEIYKSQLGLCVLATLVMHVLLLGFLAVAGLTGAAIAIGLDSAGADDEVLVVIAVLGIGLGVIALLLVSSWLQAGMFRFMLNMARHGQATVGDLFSGGPYTLPLLAAILLLMVIIGAGLVACVVPGVILMLMFSQAGFLIVDRGAGVIESLSWSKRLTDGKKTNLALILLLSMGLNYAASLVPCGIGALFVTPYIVLLMTLTYLDLTSQPTADFWLVRPQLIAATGAASGSQPQGG